MDSYLPVIAAQVVALILFRPCFGTPAGFRASLRHWLEVERDLLSALRWQWDERAKAELKLACWIVLPIATGMGVHKALLLA